MHLGMTTGPNLTQVLNAAVAEQQARNKKILIFSLVGLGALWLTLKIITRRKAGTK